MPIGALPLPFGAKARALLHHLLEHGDSVGRDAAGRTIIQLAVDDWALEWLLTFVLSRFDVCAQLLLTESLVQETVRAGPRP